MKAVESRKRNLETAARKISITPSTESESKKQKLTKPWNKYESGPTPTPKEPQYKTFIQARKEIEKRKISQTQPIEEIKRVDICKQPREGSLVVETRKGINVNCNHCNHTWTHFSKNLYKQYYTSCPSCHSNVRLKHYKVGS